MVVEPETAPLQIFDTTNKYKLTGRVPTALLWHCECRNHERNRKGGKRQRVRDRKKVYRETGRK